MTVPVEEQSALTHACTGNNAIIHAMPCSLSLHFFLPPVHGRRRHGVMRLSSIKSFGPLSRPERVSLGTVLLHSIIVPSPFSSPRPTTEPPSSRGCVVDGPTCRAYNFHDFATLPALISIVAGRCYYPQTPPAKLRRGLQVWRRGKVLAITDIVQHVHAYDSPPGVAAASGTPGSC